MNARIEADMMLIPLFCAMTGYTEKAVRRKIEDGKWLEGQIYMRAPDGHITMSLKGYYAWARGQAA